MTSARVSTAGKTNAAASQISTVLNSATMRNIRADVIFVYLMLLLHRKPIPQCEQEEDYEQCAKDVKQPAISPLIRLAVLQMHVEVAKVLRGQIRTANHKHILGVGFFRGLREVEA